MSRSQQLSASEREKGARKSGLHSPSYLYDDKDESKPPSYDRVMKGLRDREVLEEIEGGRGPVDFQEALLAEARKRGLEVSGGGE